MLTHVRRAMIGVLVLAAASVAQAQTLETFAGGRIVDNLPSLEAPVTTGAMLTTVDGTVYVVDSRRNRLMRRDPATSLLTLFPSATIVAPWNAVHNIFRSPPGNSYLYAGGALYQLFLPSGQIQLITRLDFGTTACTQVATDTQFAADWNGNIYFTDSGRNSVCKVLGFNSIQRIAGTDTAGFAGDGGPAVSARFSSPYGIAIDFENNVLIADVGNNRVRKINVGTGIITTHAGNGTPAYAGENVIAANASLAGPTYLATDSNNHLFITEIGVTRVRRLNPFTGRLNTFAGNGQQLFDSPDGGLATQTALAWPTNFAAFPNQGDYLISDVNDSRTRHVSASTGIISTFIGNGTWYFCGEGSLPRDACLDDPIGISIDATGDAYIADTRNRRVRRYSVETGMLTTIAGRDGPNQFQGEGGLALVANFGADLGGLTLDAAGNIFVAGAFSERITRIDKATGIITTVGGSGLRGFAGDGGLATAARTNYPSSVAVDSAGNIYFSDKSNHRVRKIAAGTGIITTVAGNGLSTGPLGDNGPATAASLAFPHKVGFDNAGNLLIADTQHFRVRKVNKTTGVITTIIGNGSSSNSGDGGSATNAGLNGVDSFVVDPVGNILVVSGSRLRRVDATNGTINQIPNVPMQSPEGHWIGGPGDLALDASGRLYIAAIDAVMRVSGIPPVAGDSTPPIILPGTSGSPGTNGWWRGPSKVTVQLSAFDNESFITSHSGCGTHEVTSDTAGTTFTCTATSAGGTSTLSVTVRRDSVAPTLTFGSASPAADSSGWNSTDVGVPFVGVDALSGVFSTSSGSPVIVNGEGSGLTRQVTVTDTAGNSATFTTPAFNIDRTAPTVTPNVSGTLGTNGWYTSNVEVSWSVTDTSSTVTATTGCDAAAVTTDTTGITYTCTATSAGGSTTQSVTIKRDATAPQLEFGSPSPAANAAGWHGGDVSIPFTATDATSGIASTSSADPVLISGVGANRSVDVVVKDNAGNTVTFPSPAVNIDRSAPVVTPDVSGTLGSNGWYTSNIQVAWTTSDDNAPIDTAEGCQTSVVAADTAGATFTCTASSAGGLTTQSITIKRDATPPQLVFGTPSPAANASGWHDSDVTFTFDTTDATSGIASTSTNSPLLIAGDGTGLSRQVVVTDAAGNSASFTTPPVNIDRVPPSVQPVVNGTIGNGDWYRSDVQVSWVIDESPASIISTNGCDASVVNTDTAGVTLTCSVVSGGGTASSSVTLKRDATPPVLNFGTPSPVPNSSGWNKTNVSIAFTRSDAMSGLASTSATSPLVLSTEGPGITRQVVVTDNAGNSATFTTVERNIDKTVPYAEMASPVDGATYGFYQDVIADIVCEDLSLISCTSPTPQGELINTRTAGARTFKITAKDAVGFTTNHTHAFTVESFFNFNGFLSPAGPSPTLNLVTRGALVPIRWQLPDGRGGFVTNPASFTSATVGSLTCGSATSVPLNDSASGPAGISFDAATNSFVYNWQTSTSWTGCRKLTIKLKDNSLHELRFRFQ